jgi:hypothetical protein
MAVGFDDVDFANKVLNHMLRAVASTAPAGNFVKLHTNAGDPGAAGTANASANTTRVAVTFSAASAGACASSNTPSWASWASGTETIAHISVWDASTAGTFLYSATLTTARTVNNGDTLTLSSLSVSLAPLAA